jgi:hypothetical protein
VTIAKQVGGALPKVAGFIVILILGSLLSLLLTVIFKGLFRLVKLNRLSEKAGIENFLQQQRIKKTAVDILGIVVFWFFFLLTFVIAFNTVGLTQVSAFLNSALLYIPNIFVALIILMVAYYLASLVANAARGAATKMGIERADIAQKVVKYFVMFVAVTVALGQLGISESIIDIGFALILGAIMLSVALAVGLGSREQVADWWKRILGRKPKKETKREE